MNNKNISEELTFLRKYVNDLEAMNEEKVQRLTAMNKPKIEVLNNLLSLIGKYEALLS